MHILKYDKKTRPIVAQIFGAKPENILKAAQIISDLGFDGIDINMGCPDRAVEKQGAGSALIKNPELAKRIIRAAKEGAKGIPVSVKTRVGYNTPILKEWITAILEEKPAALTIHARTRKEMSEAPAQWKYVKEAVELRDMISPETVILGNGDVESYSNGLEKLAESGADGVMVGRGIFGTPWFFDGLKDAEIRNKIKAASEAGVLDKDLIKFRLKVMLEHTKLFEKLLTGEKNFAVMKKHFKAYVNNWNGARELRNKLMEAKSAKEVEKVVKEYLAEI